MYEDDPIIVEGEHCPDCGAPLIYKDGVNGRFIGCSRFPACRYVKKEQKAEVAEETGDICPQCGKPLVKRKDKKGRTFVACSGYPHCHYVVDTPKEIVPVKPCPKCDGSLIRKRGKYGYFLACSNFPKCNYMEKITKKKRK